MHLTLAYLLAAGAGALIAYFISRAPELRSMRLSQFVLVPGALVLCVCCSYIGGVVGFVCFLPVLGFLVLLLAPNIAFYCGAGLSNFLDPQEWTPTEEEIALRPIRRLIDKDQPAEALAELDELLKKHQPTYEALLTKAKLLHHFGSVDETVATLLSLIRLSQTTAQQLAVMEGLAVLEEQHQDPPKPLAAGIRRIQLDHELILFQTDGDTAPLHKEIPAGVYEVEEISHRNHRWLRLAGENWGNAEMCWEAILAIHRPPAALPKRGLFWQIARMHQAISTVIKGNPRLQRQAEAQKLFKEAIQFIRGHDWQKARPLLQKASACDPDRYEIAYRWVQSVRQTGDAAATAQAVSQVLKQSHWTKSEQQMLAN